MIMCLLLYHFLHHDDEGSRSDFRRYHLNPFNAKKSTKGRRKNHRPKLNKSDMKNIMANLQHGTIVNQLINGDEMGPRLRNFLLQSKKLRHAALQVIKDKDKNDTELVLSSPLVPRTIVYNRIYKSGSASLLCKF